MSEEFVHDAETLKRLQAMPLDDKIALTKQRIIEFTEAMGGPDHVCISFSGGKDSSVLAHIARQIYPDIPLVFANTGLEYPEVQKHAREMGAVFVRPKMPFDRVISTYGYPLIGKEVAEAIYYARRIRNGGERERERDGAAIRLENNQTSQNEKLRCRDGGNTLCAREQETLESDRSFPSPLGITKLSAPTEKIRQQHRGDAETRVRRRDLEGKWQTEQTGETGPCGGVIRAGMLGVPLPERTKTDGGVYQYQWSWEQANDPLGGGTTTECTASEVRMQCLYQRCP